MRHKKLAIVLDASTFANWTPTRENVDALPKALRRYILDLESAPDIVELMRENFILRREISALQKTLAIKRAEPNAALLIDHFFFS